LPLLKFQPSYNTSLIFLLKVYCKVLVEYEYGCDTIVSDDNDTNNYNSARKIMVVLSTDKITDV